jgi:hypothetical protein
MDPIPEFAHPPFGGHIRSEGRGLTRQQDVEQEIVERQAFSLCFCKVCLFGLWR